MIPKFTIFQPNGWDNSILPIDIIHKLINEMNNVIDYINNMEDNSVERAKEYTDSQIATVNDSIAATNNTIDQINNSLQASIRSVNQSITVLQSQLSTYGEILNDLNSRELEHYTEIGRTITQIYSDMRDLGVQLRNYADIKDLVLKEQLEAQIEEIRIIVNDLLNLKTIDGFTGTYKTVREIIGTKILYHAKTKGGNRYALTWGQISTTSRNGWLARYSIRFNNRINYFAPTWHNFMLNNLRFASPQNLYSANVNTWCSFTNLTLLFIADIVHKCNFYCTSGTADIANNYKTVDVFKKTEWDTYITDGTPIPTVERVDINDLYDGTNKHISLILTQFKSSISIFTGSVGGYGIYSTSGSNQLFSGTSDLPALFQLLQGNLNTPFFSDTFFY